MSMTYWLVQQRNEMSLFGHCLSISTIRTFSVKKILSQVHFVYLKYTNT